MSASKSAVLIALRHLQHSSPLRSGNPRNSSSSAKTGFLTSLISNIKEEFSRNKEVKDNIAKFRQEARKLEQSEALQEVRRKYKSLESDTRTGGEYVRTKVDELGEKVRQSDLARHATRLGGEVQGHLKATAESLSKASSELGKTEAARKISSTVHGIREQLDDVTSLNERFRMYTEPVEVKKRSEMASSTAETTRATGNPIKGDATSTGVVVHKDWSWYDSWQKFKDSSPYVNKIFEFKTRYDESDNALVRASRYVTSSIAERVGCVLSSKTELSEALDEIHKVDSKFNLYDFVCQIEREIAPNVLGALSSNRLDVLKDWCHEAVFNVLCHDLKQAQFTGGTYHLKVFDIGEVELAAGKVMEQGPVLVVTFCTQQMLYVLNSDGSVQLGSKDRLKSVLHVWALCRDQSIPDPHACWRLIDISVQERGEMTL